MAATQLRLSFARHLRGLTWDYFPICSAGKKNPRSLPFLTGNRPLPFRNNGDTTQRTLREPTLFPVFKRFKFIRNRRSLPGWQTGTNGNGSPEGMFDLKRAFSRIRGALFLSPLFFAHWYVILICGGSPRVQILPATVSAPVRWGSGTATRQTPESAMTQEPADPAIRSIRSE